MKSHNCSVFLNVYVALIYIVTWRSKEQSTKKIKCFDFILYIYIYILYFYHIHFLFYQVQLFIFFFSSPFTFLTFLQTINDGQLNIFLLYLALFFLIILTFSIFALFYPSTKWTVTNSIEVYRFTYAGL